MHAAGLHATNPASPLAVPRTQRARAPHTQRHTCSGPARLVRNATHAAGPSPTHGAGPRATHAAGPCATHAAGPRDTHAAGPHTPRAELRTQRALWYGNGLLWVDDILQRFPALKKLKPEGARITPTAQPQYWSARFPAWDACNSSSSEQISIFTVILPQNVYRLQYVEYFTLNVNGFNCYNSLFNCIDGFNNNEFISLLKTS